MGPFSAAQKVHISIAQSFTKCPLRRATSERASALSKGPEVSRNNVTAALGAPQILLDDSHLIELHPLFYRAYRPSMHT